MIKIKTIIHNFKIHYKLRRNLYIKDQRHILMFMTEVLAQVTTIILLEVKIKMFSHCLK
jgi:hypothetical protein